MELKTFISHTLAQICEGVRDAQKTAEGGGAINAECSNIDGGNLINAGTLGVFTRVDFDVAVSAETSGGGGGSLKVFGVGLEGGGKHRSGLANRITFSVPVRLPDGDKYSERE